jgi:hypothetical protein
MPEPVESRERFTDEEAAFLRNVRFGALPARVRPDDWVEMTESEPPARDLILSEFERMAQVVRYAAG